MTTTSVRGGAEARAFEPVPSQAAPSATVLTSAIQSPPAQVRNGTHRPEGRCGQPHPAMSSEPPGGLNGQTSEGGEEA